MMDDIIRGMSSTLAEKEDNIVVPDLRGNKRRLSIVFWYSMWIIISLLYFNQRIIVYCNISVDYNVPWSLIDRFSIVVAYFCFNSEHLFGPLEFSRRDLVAINIQRAREHGLTDYNSIRKAFELDPLSWENVTKHLDVN